MRVRIKRIVCATDISEFSNHTLTYGVALARMFDAAITPCHIVSLPALTSYYGNVFIDPLEEQDRLIGYTREQFERQLTGAGVPWEPIIRVGHVVEELTRISQESEVDLIIAATHGRSGVKRLLLGSVTEQLMRAVACPLLIIGRPEPDREALLATPFRFGRILVGVDFSPDSTLAISYGLSLAQEFQAELHLVHVVEPPVYIDMVRTAFELGEEHHADLRRRLLVKLGEQIPPEATHWCSPVYEVMDGQAYEALLAYADRQQVDLIVLGARGYSLMEKLFVGSTTVRVARRALCPVLSVSPKVRIAKTG